MNLTLNESASELPVTLAEAKLHLRVMGTDDDDLITAMLTAATLSAEHIMGRAVMPQKWLLTLDSFSGVTHHHSWTHGGSRPWGGLGGSPLWAHGTHAITLQRAPVSAIESIKYIDSDGTQQTLDPTLYRLIPSHYTARVLPAFGEVWPATRYEPATVEIVFSCGYADAAAVPEPIKSWIKLRVGAMYENRESTVVVVGGRLTLVELPFVDTLLYPYKYWIAA